MNKLIFFITFGAMYLILKENYLFASDRITEAVKYPSASQLKKLIWLNQETVNRLVLFLQGLLVTVLITGHLLLHNVKVGLSPQKRKFLRNLNPFLAVAMENGSKVSKLLCSIDLPYAASEILGREKNIIYLSDFEKEAFRVSCLVCFNSTLGFTPSLLWGDGELVDTSKWTSKNGIGYAAYAISPEGALYVAEHRSPANMVRREDLSEKSLRGIQKGNGLLLSLFFFVGASCPGVCFGMIKIFNGKIVYIDRHSGHYKPSVENFEEAIKILKPYFAKNCHIERAAKVSPFNIFNDVDGNW